MRQPVSKTATGINGNSLGQVASGMDGGTMAPDPPGPENSGL
jgi:hypothetical protein